MCCSTRFLLYNFAEVRYHLSELISVLDKVQAEYYNFFSCIMLMTYISLKKKLYWQSGQTTVVRMLNDDQNVILNEKGHWKFVVITVKIGNGLAGPPCQTEDLPFI